MIERLTLSPKIRRLQVCQSTICFARCAASLETAPNRSFILNLKQDMGPRSGLPTIHTSIWVEAAAHPDKVITLFLIYKKIRLRARLRRG